MSWWSIFRRKPSRAPEDVLIGCLDSIAFIALHTSEPEFKLEALKAYRNIEVAAKNEGLERMELWLKLLQEDVAKRERARRAPVE